MSEPATLHPSVLAAWSIPGSAAAPAALCRGGNEHLCNQPRALGVNRDGGYATHVLVPDARYLVDFEGLDEAQACVYACSGITAYGALLKAKSLLAGGGELLSSAQAASVSQVSAWPK